METAKVHQIKAAKKTLKTPKAILDVIGGPGCAEAYEIVFCRPLLERLIELIVKYPNQESLVWELSSYGWTPVQMLEAIGGRIPQKGETMVIDNTYRIIQEITTMVSQALRQMRSR